jgi:lysozyme family protein
MKMKNYHLQSDWTEAAMLYRWEKYNGWGYRSRGIHTPYLWSFSEHYTKGKFVRDGVYDSNAVSRQPGASALLKAISSLP